MNKKVSISRSFKWLNISQFLGALNDNLFKLLLIFFLADIGGAGEPVKVIALAGILFVLPFLLFSHAGGVLADRYSKQRVFMTGRGLEILAMLIGVLGVYTVSASSLYIALFLTCSFSALTSPSKYGIIPELVKKEQLSRANGLIIAFTYIAVILGTFLPSFLLLKIFTRNFAFLAWTTVAIAIGGFITAMFIEKTKAVGAQTGYSLMFIKEIFKTLHSLRRDIYLYLAVLGSAFFMFVGTFLQSNAIVYCKEVLRWEWIKSGYLFPVAAFGIGLGGIIAGKLSGRNIEFGLVPVGVLGLGILCIFMYAVPSNVYYAGGLFLLMGMCAGIFIVPLNAFIQYASPEEEMGRIIACANFMGFLAAILSSVFFYLLNATLGFGANLSFLSIGMLTLGLMLASIIILPDFLLRFFILILVKCVYRLKIVGSDTLPIKGGALLVSNHVTLVDALLLTATTQRRLRFVMARDIYEIKFLEPIFKLMKVIPISNTDSPRQIIHSLREARQAMENGYIVCIFPEGMVTRNGNMSRFKRGMERIVKGTDCPVIPAYIGGAWGSMFSYKYGKLLSRFPVQIPYPVTIIFGNPLQSTVSVDEAEHAVASLSVEYFKSLKSKERTLQRTFVKIARRCWFKECICDTTGKRFTYGKLLITSLTLANLITCDVKSDEMVGIALPSSVTAIISNLAVLLCGKIPVNINFKSSAAVVESTVKQCRINIIISSRSFVEKLSSFKPPARIIFLEDIVSRVGFSLKVKSLLKAIFVPVYLLTDRNTNADSVATIIFSSGSTGEPKGVMLTHHNIISNVESFADIFSFTKQDKICGILPFFHSFGFTCTMWCPLLHKVRVCYHTNPLEAEKIGKLVKSEKATIIMTTPSFLLSYIRKIPDDEFATLRAVIVGAEKLRKNIADAFEEKFRIRPLEGYGATELSPVVSFNIPDVEINHVKHIGHKEGSVGHPIPGVITKIVHPDTMEQLRQGQEGLLLVKGPNVMLGYLNRPDLTAKVLYDSWYNTGDIARIDADGFIYILDRVSRYSKIAGEMVPHIAIEEKFYNSLGIVGQVLAVTSVPDEKKGEQLVVIYTPDAGTAEQLDMAINSSDLPNLWKPRKENYFMVDALPALGSGKLDFKRLKEMAMAFVQNKQKQTNIFH